MHGLYDAPFNAFSTWRRCERAIIAPVSFEVHGVPKLGDFDFFRELAGWLITIIYGIEYRLDERIFLVATVVPIEEDSKNSTICLSITSSLIDVNEVYLCIVLFAVYRVFRWCMEVEVFRSEIARCFVIKSDSEFNVLSLSFILEIDLFGWVIIVEVPT